MNNRDKFLQYFRILLMSLGGFFIGKYIKDTPIDADLWNVWAGAIISAGTLVWSIVDRVANIEMVQVTIRSVSSAGAGLIVSAGWVDESTAIAIFGVIGTLFVMWYEYTSIKKSADVAKGKLAVADLMGVDETKPQLIQPVVEAKDVLK